MKFLSLFFLSYRYFVSPFLHAIAGTTQACRHRISCSQFSERAIKKKGLRLGVWLSFKRLSGCHPFSFLEGGVKKKKVGHNFQKSERETKMKDLINLIKRAGFFVGKGVVFSALVFLFFTNLDLFANQEEQKRNFLNPLSREISEGQLQVSSENSAVENWVLYSYFQNHDEKGNELNHRKTRVDLHSVSLVAGQIRFAVDDPSYFSLSELNLEVTSQSQDQLVLSGEDPFAAVARTYQFFPDVSFFDLKIQVKFKKQKPRYAYVYLEGKSNGVKSQDESERKIGYYSDGSASLYSLYDGIEPAQVLTPVRWIGVMSHYFLFSLVDKSTLAPKALLQKTGENSGRISFAYFISESEITIPLRVYFGAKKIEQLGQVDPTLEKAVNLGFFTFIASPILKFMKWLYGFVHNYGFAIIIMTVILKILTYPLTYKSMKSMKEMAKIQPEIQRIREKNKDNKEKLNQEMLSLMKNRGYNPAAGCLPILIQMPIFFALYQVLYSAVELYQTPFMGWIHDLSAKDPYFVTPILLTAVMFLQQKLTPTTATDPMQKKMMQFMPLIFGIFMISLPAGLTLYMLTNVVVGIIQQIILNKKLGIQVNPTTKNA